MGMSNRWDALYLVGRVLPYLNYGSCIAEYGNQIITSDMFGVPFPAKLFYTSLGFRHVSFDLNGKDGALPIDLSKPLPHKYLKQFDLVTNFGCMEHIENQQQAWSNFFQLGKYRSWQLHVLPLAGCWPNHGLVHYLPDIVKAIPHIHVAYRQPYRHSDGRSLDTLCILAAGRYVVNMEQLNGYIVTADDERY